MLKTRSFKPDYIKKLTHDSVPASVGLVKAVRNELCARLDGVDTKVKGMEKSLTARINGVEKSLTARINGVETSLTARIDGVDTRINSLETSINGRATIRKSHCTGWHQKRHRAHGSIGK